MFMSQGLCNTAGLKINNLATAPFDVRATQTHVIRLKYINISGVFWP